LGCGVHFLLSFEIKLIFSFEKLGNGALAILTVGSERSNKLPYQENGENLPYPDDDDLNRVLIVLERLLVLVVGSLGIERGSKP
jgi:hypothetical protein